MRSLLEFEFSPGVKRRLEATPELQQFEENIRPFVSSPDSNEFWKCESAFVELLASSFLTRLVNHELTLIAEEGSYLAVGLSSETSFTVMSTPHFGLSIRILSGQSAKPRLLGSVEHSMIGLTTNSPAPSLVIEEFEQRHPDPHDVLDRTRKLVALGRRTIAAGAIVRRRAGIDVGRFIFEGRTVVPIIFSSQVVRPLRWEYDPVGLNPIRVVAADVQSSRIEFACKLLARLGDDACIANLRSLSEHPDHFVRWAAVTAIVAIDPNEGLDALTGASNDIHPHVRTAATKGIAKLHDAMTAVSHVG